jgi:hypothetical protein
VKFTAAEATPLQTVWLAGKLTVGALFTVATTAERLAEIQPEALASA